MNSPFLEMGAGSRGATSTLGFRRVVTPLTPFGDAPSGGWKPENSPTNPDATPDYDGVGWDSWWTSNDWMTWHRSLKARFGLDEANVRFINAWQKQTIGSTPLDARSFDTNFRDYAKANGFFDALYYGLGALAKPIGATTDVITGVTQGVSTVANLAKYVIPVAALAFAYLFFVSKAPKR
jgi:hypothetical protein